MIRKMPQDMTKDKIFDMFINRICGNDEVYISGEPIEITVNYKITDPEYKNQEAIIPEKEGEYTESPVIEINNVNAFKKALYDYVKTYIETDGYWTDPDIARDSFNAIMYAMTVIWTDATNQDFTNPVDFLNRYKAFLTQDQWNDLDKPKKVKAIDGTEFHEVKSQCNDEREAPNNFSLFDEDSNGQKYYFPSVVYGIRDNKAYVYAIHQIYNKRKKETEKMQKLRNTIKGRGVEPLGIASLLAFIQEAKGRGIKQIVMPDNFVMQYTTKNKIRLLMGMKEPEYEEKIDKNHMSSMNKRLIAMMHISKYYSTGIKFIEIPGEVSDNLTVDIQDFKFGKEEKENVDPRKNKRNDEQER